MSDLLSKHINCFNPAKEKDVKSNQKIYHYTSPQGLFNILKSGKIRFTDCQFLNDKSEYKHILTPLKKAMKEARGQLDNPSIFDEDVFENCLYNDFQSTGVRCDKGVSGFKGMHSFKQRYYVFCATESSDSLNMWNYYVKGGNYQGYNIELSVNELLKCFSLIENPDINIFYGKVIYSEKDKIDILRSAILKADSEYSINLKYTSSWEDVLCLEQETLGKLFSYIEDNRLFFKDNAFVSEKEYRFVILLPNDYESNKDDVLNAGYEMRNGILTPYCELNYDKENTISEIALSPMLETELAENGLKRFLDSSGFNGNVKINQSQIPIRY